MQLGSGGYLDQVCRGFTRFLAISRAHRLRNIARDKSTSELAEAVSAKASTSCIAKKYWCVSTPRYLFMCLPNPRRSRAAGMRLYLSKLRGFCFCSRELRRIQVVVQFCLFRVCSNMVPIGKMHERALRKKRMQRPFPSWVVPVQQFVRGHTGYGNRGGGRFMVAGRENSSSYREEKRTKNTKRSNIRTRNNPVRQHYDQTRACTANHGSERSDSSLQ